MTVPSQNELSKIEEVIADAKAGKLFILVDDEARENEGDLCVVAECATADAINFMAKYGRGLICLALTRQRTEALGLTMMDRRNESRHETAFTISIEAREGVTTGISAADRALTIKTAINPACGERDITTPGHIFPLMAQAGGVLTRAGHTEAGCDLARIAGFEPSAVIVEILSEDGTMARLPELQKIADKHDFKIGSIEDLIKYRVANEKTVKKVSCNEIETDYGEFNVHLYQDLISKTSHLALVKGDIDKEKPTLVRVHVQNTIQDIIHTKNSKSWPLENAIKKIKQNHVNNTSSVKGKNILSNWDKEVSNFKKVMPTEFKRVLTSYKKDSMSKVAGE